MKRWDPAIDLPRFQACQSLTMLICPTGMLMVSRKRPMAMQMARPMANHRLGLAPPVGGPPIVILHILLQYPCFVKTVVGPFLVRDIFLCPGRWNNSS